MLYRVVYASTSKQHITHQLIEPICRQAAVRNRQLGVTGLLLFNSKYFMQMIEGPRDVINDLLFRISRNKLHGKIEILCYEPISERIFTYYGVKMYADCENSRKIIFKFTSNKEFNPYHAIGQASVKLLEQISGVSSEVLSQNTSHIFKFLKAS